MKSERHRGLISALCTAAGARNTITAPARMSRYTKGFRYGGGSVAAVVTPTSLVALWLTLEACVAADAIIIMQAANTGLTGGSTPDGDDYDRVVVMISPMAIDAIHLIDDGRQAVCLPGSTLYALEALLKPLDREPHSVIGSSCIGASIIGGVCNSSGGSLIRRGPAYTELALYARLDVSGRLELVNHLGLKLTGDIESMLDRLQHGKFTAEDLVATDAVASDTSYCDRVRDVDADTPARYNANPQRLYEASGCAGRIAVFAVRLDTFPIEEGTATFYIGTNDPDQLTQIRLEMLTNDGELPIAAEYMHRDCFDIAARYGKDTFLTIWLLGTRLLPAVFRLKAALDRSMAAIRFRPGFSDRLLQRISQWLPGHLPSRMVAYRDRFSHHLMLKVPASAIERSTALLQRILAEADSAFFRCNEVEAAKAFLHRFAAAGAAIRYKEMHASDVADIIALDIALRRNDHAWVETLPDDISDKILQTLYYGHFFCQVFHQDYIIRAGADCAELEQRMLALLDRRGAKYPAEHNVGHLYKAEAPLVAHYRHLDPTNALNPGIGQTPKSKGWN